jgi:electron transport complex protein RnfB
MIAVIILTLLCIAFGIALGFAAVKFKVEGDPLVDNVDAVLPQTQCGQCGYPGCRPYAQAIVNDNALINQCPPGGMDGVRALATLLEREVIELNPDNGTEKEPAVAIIDEQVCIGCTLCIQACPVDAIVGAAKLMHTVIASECTGCELCLPPCPVDCIIMESEKINLQSWRWTTPKASTTAKAKSQENLAP